MYFIKQNNLAKNESPNSMNNYQIIIWRVYHHLAKAEDKIKKKAKEKNLREKRTKAKKKQN